MKTTLGFQKWWSDKLITETLLMKMSATLQIVMMEKVNIKNGRRLTETTSKINGFNSTHVNDYNIKVSSYNN